jgi:hypothetical protein
VCNGKERGKEGVRERGRKEGETKECYHLFIVMLLP